jgi:hypothetical protein
VPVVSEYDGEATDARLARRAEKWMPALVRRGELQPP